MQELAHGMYVMRSLLLHSTLYHCAVQSTFDALIMAVHLVQFCTNDISILSHAYVPPSNIIAFNTMEYMIQIEGVSPQ